MCWWLLAQVCSQISCFHLDEMTATCLFFFFFLTLKEELALVRLPALAKELFPDNCGELYGKGWLQGVPGTGHRWERNPSLYGCWAMGRAVRRPWGGGMGRREQQRGLGIEDGIGSPAPRTQPNMK